MRVIIDGCDGTGKTTIVEKLANRLNCNIIRLTKNGPRLISSYEYLMSAEDVVHDRSFLSELIYPKYFNEEHKLPLKAAPHLWEYLRKLNVKFFILTATNDEIRRRVVLRGDEFIKNIEILENINDDYVRIAQENNVPVIDTTGKSIDEILNEIEGYLYE